MTGAPQGLDRALAAGLTDRGVFVVLADTATGASADHSRGVHRQRRTSVADGHRRQRRGGCEALASRPLEPFGRVDVVVNVGIATGDSRPLWRTDRRTGSVCWR